MADNFTKRNHYNPCFWTACWNLDYFRALVEGRADSITPREQEVYVLNLQSGKIYPGPVSNVHLDKNLGLAEITPESMKDFCLRRYPAEYESFCLSVDKDPETVYMDFEDILTGMEGLAGYQSLMEAVSCGIQNVMQKGFLTCHIVIQAMRSHEMMNSMIDTTCSMGMSKWEYFWLLKNAWSNMLVWAEATTPLALSRWVLYETENHSYPLCDSPVMIDENTIMVVLSPRLLLEINLNEPATEDTWTVRKGISNSKFREFRRRSIHNSFKELIFHDPDELEIWRNTREFKARSKDLSDRDKAAQLRKEAANRVNWLLMGSAGINRNYENR